MLSSWDLCNLETKVTCGDVTAESWADADQSSDSDMLGRSSQAIATSAEDSKPHYGCDIPVGAVLKGRSGYGRGKVKDKDQGSSMGSDCFPEWEAHSVWYRYRSRSVSHLTKSSQKDRKSQAILSTENLSNYALPVKGQFIGKLRKDQEVEQELYTVEKLRTQLLGCPAVEVLEFAVHIETVEWERRINLPSCFSD